MSSFDGSKRVSANRPMLIHSTDIANGYANRSSNPDGATKYVQYLKSHHKGLA